MKHLLTLALALALALAPKTQAAEKSILEQISLTPVGAYQQAEFSHGPGQWGAGIDLGLPINSFVYLHVRNLAFEQGDWGGSVIDETSIYGRADFVKFAQEKFRLFGTGGGTRHWETEDWSFGLGLGVEYRFTKHIAVNVAREIRAYTSDAKRDWLTVAGVSIRF